MKSFYKKFHKNDEGVALVTAMMIALVTTILAVSMNMLATEHVRRSIKDLAYEQALYVADGAAEKAIWSLINIPEYEGEADVSFGRGVYSTSVDKDGSNYVITTTAYVPDASNPMGVRSIEVIVNTISSGNSSPEDIILGYGAASLGNITMEGNARLLYGNGYAGGNVVLSGNAIIEDDLDVVGSLSTSGNARVEGDVDSDPEEISLPTVSTSSYKADAEAGGTWYGNYSLGGNGTSNIGPLYITGNLSLSGNRIVHVIGTIYVEGTISMSGNARIESCAYPIVSVGNAQFTGNSTSLDDIPLLISVDGNITISGNGDLPGVCFAPNGDVTISGNGKIHGGAIAGGNISLGGNARIYKTDLADDIPLYLESEGGDIGDVSIVRWREIRL